ncbi:hypothetical protein [Haladaptatus sp. R4]|uniref:hypothetical protein n=1 Tax=Haladaptatus sp. R4 TaxID=1679489 RepID=UPI000AFB1AF3|nr:hypothetical protein [Haladaptatus sp. R4]
MATQREAFSVFVALQFVVVSAVLLVLLPLDVVAPIIPLFLVFSFGLYKYRS